MSFGINSDFGVALIKRQENGNRLSQSLSRRGVTRAGIFLLGIDRSITFVALGRRLEIHIANLIIRTDLCQRHLHCKGPRSSVPIKDIGHLVH